MLRRVKQGVKKFDMFNTKQFLRYKEQTEYATLTGACLSVCITTVIILLVSQVVISTLSKADIFWSQTSIKQNPPSDITIPLDQMKFGLNMVGLNLNDPNVSYFDVTAESAYFINNGTIITTPVDLEPCTLEGWNDTQDIRNIYERNQGSRWLCPRPGQFSEIGGRWTGIYEKSLRFEFFECGSVNSSKTNCATPAQMESFFALNNGIGMFVPMVVNPLIQPDQKDPVSYYVDDTHFTTFGQSLGVNYFMHVSEYEVETDNSLLPVAEITVDKGQLLDSEYRSFQFDKVNSTQAYVTAVFRKSSTNYNYKRSFNKIDETISYAGGLIGVVVGIFFIMQPYTQLCFELSVANRLFCDQNGHPLQHSVNFLKFVLYAFYTIFSSLGCCEAWKEYRVYAYSSDQTMKQLDIVYLIRRINTLERIIYSGREFDKSVELNYRMMKLDEASEKQEVLNRVEELSEFGKQSGQSQSIDPGSLANVEQQLRTQRKSRKMETQEMERGVQQLVYPSLRSDSGADLKVHAHSSVVQVHSRRSNQSPLHHSQRHPQERDLQFADEQISI